MRCKFPFDNKVSHIAQPPEKKEMSHAEEQYISIVTARFQQQTEKAAQPGRERKVERRKRRLEQKKEQLPVFQFSEGHFCLLLLVTKSVQSKMKNSTIIAFSVILFLTFLANSEGKPRFYVKSPLCHPMH